MLDHPFVRVRHLFLSLLMLAQGCGSDPLFPLPDAHVDPPSAMLDGGAPPCSDDSEPDAASPHDDDAGSLPEVPYTLSEVEANGFVFNVWLAGPSDGEPVILLHGFPETSYEWRKTLPALVAQGYRVIAPDQRGYSPKARPTEDEAYAVILLAEDVLAIADAVSARAFHLVGHDWGGGVAWLVAKLAPLRILSLTAVGTPHPDAMKSKLEDPSSCQHKASAYFDNVVKPDAAAQFIADPMSLVPEANADPLPEPETYLELLRDEATVDAALAWYRANIEDRTFKAIFMGPVDTPTLLVLGEKELFFCRDTAELSAEYVDASFRFESIAAVGHWVPEQASDEFLELLLPHLAAQRGRVAGAMPQGPDASRPFGEGLTGVACVGAPEFEVPSGVASCDDICPEAHCMPANMLGESAALAPDCEGEGQKCVPDALSRSLGRFSLPSCKSLFGPAVCVPRCLAGVFGAFLFRGTCGAAELCAPCTNPLTGKPTGACEERCQGL